MLRRLILAAMCWSACALAQAADPGPSFGEYARGLITTRRVIGTFVSVGINTGRNSPEEWGRTWSGTGRRFASSYGGGLVKHTFSYPIAAAHDENLRYAPSNLTGIKARGWHAIKGTFVVPRRQGTGTTIALGPLCGNLASGLMSRLWLPDSGRTVRQGLTSSGIGISADVGWNLLREFVFRKKR